ncbi:DUF4365 domain-containing protein [Lichenibacterium dinghuense]|uniref:DUF4365 domain-containing protein n=1 Tax=Lichenibacterium dinghuense TaxID=2895977 RepID=UPI001F2A7479|nr:DUF4365 domain-containing protein [Lichenibacterium sp. 6Y81]
MTDDSTAERQPAALGSDLPPEQPVSDRSWAHLDRLKVGRYGECFVKMALVRAGLDVFSPEVDDKAIDLVIRIPSSPPRYLDVQVKTARGSTGYVFMRKRHFTIEANRYLALVLLNEGDAPEMYLIPSTAWREPQSPFSSRDYPGLKSEPEYGLALTPAALQRLQAFRFTGQLDMLATDGPLHLV